MAFPARWVRGAAFGLLMVLLSVVCAHTVHPHPDHEVRTCSVLWGTESP